jgi:hypothetical protein
VCLTVSPASVNPLAVSPASAEGTDGHSNGCPVRAVPRDRICAPQTATHSGSTDAGLTVRHTVGVVVLTETQAESTHK